MGRNPNKGGIPASERSKTAIVVLWVDGMVVVFVWDFKFVGFNIEMIAVVINRYIRKYINVVVVEIGAITIIQPRWVIEE